jgi:nucleoid-associated protein YgaU
MDQARRAGLENTRKAFEGTQADVARLTGARGIYTVQRTDSLSEIAAFFYHNGYRWPDIFKANAFLISHPDLIYPGMVLIIPR